MFLLRNNSASANALAQAAAISKSQAVIEFDMDGKVITANQNFLDALGYRLEEIQGKHHSMFVTPAMRESAEYRGFWANLNRGEHQAAEYKRIGKGGREVWIHLTASLYFVACTLRRCCRNRGIAAGF
jgi:methyl-accepting chemotaxis protein